MSSDPTSHRYSAIILSAGLSSRMPAFKPLLRFGTSTVIEKVINTFKDSGVEDIVVIVGHRSVDLIPVVEQTGCRWVLNEAFAEGMFTSVQKGVTSLSPNTKAFFVMPVDIPMVRSTTVTELLEFYEPSGALIAYPVFRGKRGHPPLVSASLIEEIISYNGNGGLRAVLRAHESTAQQVPVNDEGILLDMDTPEDYDALLKRLSEK